MPDRKAVLLFGAEALCRKLRLSPKRNSKPIAEAFYKVQSDALRKCIQIAEHVATDNVFGASPGASHVADEIRTLRDGS